MGIAARPHCARLATLTLGRTVHAVGHPRKDAAQPTPQGEDGSDQKHGHQGYDQPIFDHPLAAIVTKGCETLTHRQLASDLRLYVRFSNHSPGLRHSCSPLPG